MMERAIRSAVNGQETLGLYVTLTVKSAWFKGLTGVTSGTEPITVAMDVLPRLPKKKILKDWEEEEAKAAEAAAIAAG
jgi:hypothetical protein